VRRVALALALFATAALPACGSHRKPYAAIPRPDRATPSVGTVEEGMASWYGPGYDGNRTSCGDRFDQDALTAAHPTWACGTRVKVTLLSTGRSAVVTVNDLFPGHKGRIVDLSRGAAKAIGLIGPGTGEVRLEVVRLPGP
jgi:rare lipoprotein A (peptidoglycan hydrolase)